ncbi:MAG TPA: amino acid adenylation domain-containing protein [Candidatus Acidoferrum sp.]|nr:amino acid adenylation domain-containing protein [Candidatus Acidoferrum sp.]
MKRRNGFRSLIDGFLESVERFPERTALAVDCRLVSYSDMCHSASRIASAIVHNEQNWSPLAAVWACRSLTAYAGILGALSTGKGYVPLNPKFPLERTCRMLSLSRCSVLIVGQECLSQLPNLLAQADGPLTVVLPEVHERDKLQVTIDGHRLIFADQLPENGLFPIRADVGSENIAYLLFTSGSTGEPKGVPISHGNVRSYVDYVSRRYEVNEHDRFSQQFDLTFDLSVHDMFVCWERGASLYCVPEKSVMAPAKFIRDHQLTMWFSVPSVAGLLAKMRLLSRGSFPSLRCSLFCGEPLPGAYAQAWQEAAPNSIVENLYGPTETTIAITHYRWDSASSPMECVNGIVPIGQIFEGQQFRITNPRGETVPKGAEGELRLSGSQVAHGYWNNPEKSGKQFLPLPGEEEQLWYRTGDIVKLNEAGNLCYLGRIDQQIKIRGYRVELQEIESVLRKACGTEQVVSVPWPVNDGSAGGVVAFVSGVRNLDEARVLASCSALLPDYMVPKSIYLIDELPLNSNQKIDRGKLASLLKGAA